MNLEKVHLDDNQKALCVDMGKILARACLENFDGNEKFNQTVAAKLSPEDRKRLLDEVIFYRIFFVDFHCQEKLDPTRYKYLFSGMEQIFLERLSATNIYRLNDKLLECSEIPFDEYVPQRLIEQAGFVMKVFPAEVYANLKVWFVLELAKLQAAISETVKFLNASPSEQKAFLRRLDQPSHEPPPIKRSPKPEPKESSFDKVLGLSVIVAMVIVFVVLNYNGTHDTSPSKPPQSSTTSTSPKPRPAEKTSAPKKVEPVAKIGVRTGYDYRHPILNDDGLCEFTIDNTRNDMPVYVRIWDVTFRRPVRAFTIAQGDKFTARDLSPGTYEVRYKELYENDAPPFGSKSEPTTLEQHETYSGIRYSTVELTLYKVRNGNTTTTRIDADDV